MGAKLKKKVFFHPTIVGSSLFLENFLQLQITIERAKHAIMCLGLTFSFDSITMFQINLSIKQERPPDLWPELLRWRSCSSTLKISADYASWKAFTRENPATGRRPKKENWTAKRLFILSKTSDSWCTSLWYGNSETLKFSCVKSRLRWKRETKRLLKD